MYRSSMKIQYRLYTGHYHVHVPHIDIITKVYYKTCFIAYLSHNHEHKNTVYVGHKDEHTNIVYRSKGWTYRS